MNINASTARRLERRRTERRRAELREFALGFVVMAVLTAILVLAFRYGQDRVIEWENSPEGRAQLQRMTGECP